MIEIKEDSPIYYIYRVIRLDKNEPFYIGKGTIRLSAKGEKGRYYRAYNMSGRSALFNKIYEKTKCEIEILFEHFDLDLIYKKEIEFISMYGRKDLRSGTLANLSDGGQSGMRQLVSTEVIEKIRKTKKNMAKKGGESSSAKKVFAYSKEGRFLGEYPSYSDCAEGLNISRNSIGSYFCNKDGYRKTAGGYLLFHESQGEICTIPQFETRFWPKAIRIEDKDGNLKEFTSKKEAEKNTGIYRKMINIYLDSGKRCKKGNLYTSI